MRQNIFIIFLLITLAVGTIVNENNKTLNIQHRYQFQNLRGQFNRANGQAKGRIKSMLPTMVFWRKRQMERIRLMRMQRCVAMLNADICNNRGSFYRWGRMMAQRIHNGQQKKL